MPDNILILSLAAIVASLAFMFQRVTGFGSAIIATPILALFWVPHYAINHVLIYQWIFGTLLIFKTWRSLKDPKLIWFLVPFVPALVAGVYILPGLSPQFVRISIAVVAILVMMQWLLIPKYTLNKKLIIPVAIIAGITSGAVQGAFGIGGLFFLAYYGSVEKRATHMRDATIAVFFIANLLRLPFAISTAQFPEPVLWAAALTVIPFTLGMIWGGKLTKKINETFYRYAVIVILAIAAINLFWKASA